MKNLSILFSFKTTLVLLAILAIGAGYATFVENDFGTSSARVLVYNNIWYESILVLTCINMIGISLFCCIIIEITANPNKWSSFVTGTAD